MFCECGCGVPTPLAKCTCKSKGWIKGKPKRFIHGHNNRGKGANGGRVINRAGYVLILVPGHPRADQRGYVLEHILVLEKALGRPVLTTEASHHRDKVRSNNSPGNLMLFKTKGMHRSYHERLKAFAECGHYDWRKCMFCMQHDDPNNMSSYQTKINIRYYHKHCHAKYDRERYHKIRNLI